ncbi:MAG: DJ-1/PfpI family protein [Chromatiales bacterium]|nr:DJ-1/PfpI family protein [Chromatiales bacterium]
MFHDPETNGDRHAQNDGHDLRLRRFVLWREPPGGIGMITRIAVAWLAMSTASNPVFAARPTEHIDAHDARFGRARPVVAVVGENAGTELADFVIPYGILSRSGAAEVLAVATQPGPMQMRPALRLQPDLTLASFDERFPDGADYVIVPAVMTTEKKPSALVEWIRNQSTKGASIVSICDGALTVAEAGVFKGRRATGHWATYSRRKRDYPDTQWLENTRYVADGKALSSAGVTAAIPLSLALVEAIAGTERAMTVARDLGLSDWNNAHDSDQFHLGPGVYLIAIRNWLLPRQEIGLPVTEGMDEIALALTADAFSRTYRSRAYTVAEFAGPVRTRAGLALLPDRVKGDDALPRYLREPFEGRSTQALDAALTDIAALYGRSTANFVGLQLEYPRAR